MSIPPEWVSVARDGGLVLFVLAVLWAIIKDPPYVVPFSRFKEMRDERDLLLTTIIDFMEVAREGIENTAKAAEVAKAASALAVKRRGGRP